MTQVTQRSRAAKKRAAKKKSTGRTILGGTRGWVAAGTLAAYSVMGGTRSALAQKENLKVQASDQIGRVGSYLPNLGSAQELKDAAFRLTPEAPVATAPVAPPPVMPAPPPPPPATIAAGGS